MSYSAGETVVHPRHGVGTVQSNGPRPGSKSTDSYVELLFPGKSLTVTLPVTSLEQVGIRALSTRPEAEAILAILEEPSEVPAAWSERNATTTSRIKSAELAQASMVIRDLTRHSERAGKPLSPAEKTQLDECLDVVSHELSLALELSQDDTRALILNKVATESASA